LIRSGLCGCYHAHQLRKPVLMEGPALCERNGLVTVRLGTEKCSDLIKDAAEIRSGAEGFEPACGPVVLLDAPMILLEMIIQVAVRPMRYPIPKDVPNGAWIGIMAIGGDAVWDHAGHGCAFRWSGDGPRMILMKPTHSLTPVHQEEPHGP
jgi:hypothetical protein